MSKGGDYGGGTRSIREFLDGKRFGVAGVSRRGDVAANAVFKNLRGCGFETFPINPNADEVEGETCYPDVASVPGVLDGVVIGTHPSVARTVVEQCAEAGVRRVWCHRAFGEGSVSPDAVDACNRHGIEYVVGGCPLMFCEPVDFGHKYAPTSFKDSQRETRVQIRPARRARW
ncbi:MAG TPA: CoA-binding protein [Gemmatimonadales bacterium]